MYSNGNGSTRRDPRALEGVIANLPMLRQAQRAQVAELARHARAVDADRGTVVLRKGDPMPGLYAVAYGMVTLALRADSGEEKVLRLVGPGETFGEAAVFLERPCPVDVTAVSDTLLVMLPAAPVFSLLEREPRLARSIIAALSQRMHGLVDDLAASTLQGGLQRVAAYLMAHAQREADGGSRVHLPTTKTVIAAHLGVTKETFSRMLRELARHDLVRVARREIDIVDSDRLDALARHGPRALLEERVEPG